MYSSNSRRFTSFFVPTNKTKGQLGALSILYPANLFENLKAMEFNGKQYMCAADPDTMLRIEYGDYMQLPPEEERVWKHHPILIDFEHNYEELMQG